MFSGKNQKKIIIIGAGISGLSTGIFGQKNGYTTEIFEKNPVAGGLCRCWNRKGFNIDGCIHWLTGVKPDSPIRRLWDELEAFIKKVPETVLVVIDEAYLEFVSKPNTYSMIKLINEGYDKPLLVLKTFSKAYGMAGLRIGVAAGKPELISYLGKSGAAWNINFLGQRMATAALQDQEYLKKIAGLNAIERDKVTAALKEMGCKVYESQTNFILFKAPKLENTEIFAKLAEQKVLIGAPVGMNRVSIGTAEMNDKFIKVMQEILK